MQIPQANLFNMLNAISQGNHVLNEQIQFYKQTQADCPDCEYDPIRKESTDPYCETCNGVGSIITETYDQIGASVEQEEDFNSRYTTAGKITKGQIFITVDIKEINEILNLSTGYDLNDYDQMKKFVEGYEYIKWKGAKYAVESFEPGWLQGNLYEIGLTLNLVSD